MAKKVSVIAALAALNRGLRKKLKSSIGWSQWSSHQANAASRTAPTRKATMVVGSVQPFFGASMIAKSTVVETDDRQHGADRVEPGCGRILGVGDEEDAGHQADGDDGQVHQEDRAPVEVLEQEAAGQRAERGAEPGRGGPDADGLAPLAGREHVGDDGQRGGHDERRRRCP